MFHSIKNLSSQDATVLARPWEWVPKEPPPWDWSKAEFVKWCIDLKTEHAFLSGYEGMSPKVRIGKETNEPYRMTALLVDYDLPLNDDPEAWLRKHAPSGAIPPQWLVVTKSGNGRLVWLLEKPGLIIGTKVHKARLTLMTRYLKLAKWLGGFEAEALTDLHKYYDIGRKWIPIEPDTRIPANMWELWTLDAASKSLKPEKGAVHYEVPLEDVTKEAERRFPGRWAGSFEPGSRGVRFWDPTADNPTAAVVHKDGMICFTGGEGFVSWGRIFGDAFVRKYKAKAVAEAVGGVVRVAGNYWYENNDGELRPHSKEQLTLMLKARGHSSRGDGNGKSEIDVLINDIIMNSSADKALPLLYFPQGLQKLGTQRIFNTCRTVALPPGPPYKPGPVAFADGKSHFPFIHRLLSTMFKDPEDPETEAAQITALLCWIWYFYKNSVDLTPKPGHMLVLAGGVNKGKTLFSRVLLSKLAGGHGDPNSYLVEGKSFNDHLTDKPIWSIDDSEGGRDYKTRNAFTAKIKAIVANGEMVSDGKYRDTGQVPWRGRIVLSMNTDDVSMAIMPDQDQHSKDKFLLLKASDWPMEFGAWGEAADAVDREAHAFGRFLYDWAPPSEWVGPGVNNRFGVRHYLHKDLMDHSLQLGAGPLIDMLHQFMDQWTETRKEKIWRGPAIQLHVDMEAMFPSLMREISAHAFSTKLGVLAGRGYNLQKSRDSHGRRVWEITSPIISEEDLNAPDAP